MPETERTNWPKQKLGSLFRIETLGCVPADAPRDLFRHYSLPSFDETGGPAIEEGQTIESNKLRLTEPCVLVSKLNPRIPRVTIYRPVGDDLPVCASTEFIPYIATSPDALLDFYARYFGSECFRKQLERVATGTTNSHVRLRPHETLKWEVHFPPPDEQRTIADILDAVDAAIERTRRAIERAQRLKRGLLQQAFAPGRYTRARLKDWTSDIRYGTSQAANERGWGHPTLRIPNIIGGVIDTADLTFVDTRPADRDRYGLKAGDLLMVRTNGNPNYVGRAAVFTPPDGRTWLFASYLIRVRLDDSWLSQFIAEFLNSDRGRRELFRRVSTSAGNYNVNTKNILSITAPKPSKPEQEKLVALVNAANARVTAIQSQLSALDRLKRGLMQDLLTGKVRVNPAPN